MGIISNLSIYFPAISTELHKRHTYIMIILRKLAFDAWHYQLLSLLLAKLLAAVKRQISVHLWGTAMQVLSYLWIKMNSHTCQGYPGFCHEHHWKSVGLPEISRVTWQVWPRQNGHSWQCLCIFLTFWICMTPWFKNNLLQIVGTILTYSVLVFQLKSTGTDGCDSCGFCNITCALNMSGNTAMWRYRSQM